MKEQVKALWKLCFDDTEQFIEMYFKMRYTDERNIALQDQGQVVSALQMIPYPMTFCGYTVPTSYISGACTHPNFRGNGVMRDLLYQAFEEMMERGVLFSTLIPAEPWLFSYYERMGYASVFQYSLKDITISSHAVSTSIAITSITEYNENVYQYLNRKLSERPCCIQHTSGDFKVVMADLALSDGYLFVAQQNQIIQGIAIVYIKDECTKINELFSESEEIEQDLLYYISQYFPQKDIVRLLPADQSIPYLSMGMARIINIQKVLQLYASAFPDNEMRLEIIDEQLPANKGYYHVYQGVCHYKTKPFPWEHTQMNVTELTQRILTPLKPYMSLMLD